VHPGWRRNGTDGWPDSVGLAQGRCRWRVHGRGKHIKHAQLLQVTTAAQRGDLASAISCKALTCVHFAVSVDERLSCTCRGTVLREQRAR